MLCFVLSYTYMFLLPFFIIAIGELALQTILNLAPVQI